MKSHHTIMQVGLFTIGAALILLGSSYLGAEHHEDAHANMWEGMNKAVAVLHPTEGNTAHGTVMFVEEDGKVRVHANLSGLNPGQKHAIHVHQWGDVSVANGTGAGGHYNPQGHDHALPDKPQRHAGDLGNLEADGDGNVHYNVTVDNISIAGLKNPIIGRGVIVHAKVDDGGQPTGNAGARIAQGVIGLAKPAQ